ncbi:hypothetical protein GLOTRDRAFT_122703 [Gloeophyllum trabeum ATCC 11539]|uniref:UbiA prenyltransferase n=1 Tax=Gloeophyllum trabeum (strain ATCC 11539 / FP-39264 / Madison 617) TaxID=670483 RepID=S7PYP6_GLOTA|nr:uncharacterized protein GLOTRDRAFT_122703 [Gloeophyllum trabeum ATCC 11539]EPQ52776.1 hypothetical protein GLOTRDRAFT_122703 [Gloeophyllum trabeum ATCC 11539]
MAEIDSCELPDGDVSVLSLPRLKDELIGHPLMTSMGSLALSTFISKSVYGAIDWRPVLICVSSDVLTIGLDHYYDQTPMLHRAKSMSDDAALSVFSHARLLLLANAAVLIVTLLRSPWITSAITAVFIIPALLWNQTLFYWKSGTASNPTLNARAPLSSSGSAFVIKRIPGMKAVFIGIIRGCGTFAVVHSLLSSSYPARPHGGWMIWTPTQVLVWSTINRTCHAVMADIRDFTEDWSMQIPTIPVLLKSVTHTKFLLTIVHFLTLLIFYRNVFIVLGSVYATILVWALDEKSDRKLYRLSFHSQTLVAIIYWIAHMYPSA